MIIRTLYVVAVVALLALSGCKKDEKAAEKTADKAAEKTADKAAEKTADKAAEKTADKSTDKPAEKASDKPAADQKKAPEAKAAGSNHEKFVGEWGFDFEKMAGTDPELKKQLEAQPGAKAQMEKMFGSMSIVATKEKMTMKFGPETHNVTYKVTSDDGNKLVIAGTDDKGKTETVSLSFEGNDIVVMGKDGEAQKMHLKRKK